MEVESSHHLTGVDQFSVGHEKPFPQEVKSLSWSHGMDLLAVVTQENILEVSRPIGMSG